MGQIYKITNTLSGHFYIGQTVNDVETRFKGHLKSMKSGSQGVLHRAIRKYGKDIFELQVLEDNLPKDKLNEREIYFINSLNPEYNLTQGGTGGSTTHNKKWITNGVESKYISIDDISHIDEGWRLGRTCKFSDPKFQQEMSKRSDRQKAGRSTSKAWKEGRVNRDNSKIGRKGDDNVTKRPEVKAKIKEKAIERANILIQCPYCGKEGKHSPGMFRFHFDNCKNKQVISNE